MSAIKQISFQEWRDIARRLYLERLHGYPHAEMRRYYNQNMSPLEAIDAAVKKRVKNPR